MDTMSRMMTEQELQAATDWVNQHWTTVDPLSIAHEYQRDINKIMEEIAADSPYNDVVGIVSHSRWGLREILRMIAHHVTSPDNHNPKLSKYKGVKEVSLLALRALQPELPLPDHALRRAFTMAEEANMLLAVDYVEFLTEGKPVDEALKGILTNTERAIVIGLYEEGHNWPQANTAINFIRWVPVHDLSKAQVYRYLAEQHGDDWKARGCFLDKKALDEVFALMRGLWLNRDHATIPLVFVRLVEATVQFIERAKQGSGDQEVSVAIEDALDEITNLTSFEWSHTDDARAAQPLLKCVEASRQIIEQFRSDRTLRPDDRGLYTIQAKHILTTLFSKSSACSFHFPGNQPE
jgi:hypothetical protein